jgi:hypothetical protein
MSAASMPQKPPITDADAAARPSSTTLAVISALERLHLDEARAHLTAASDALDGRYARQTTAGHSYVADGHKTIRLIDTATRELYRVRTALIGELASTRTSGPPGSIA